MYLKLMQQFVGRAPGGGRDPGAVKPGFCRCTQLQIVLLLLIGGLHGPAFQ
jgi:hypothetical protein